MIQPFQLISISYLIAQSIAGVHAFPNSTGHHLVPLVPDLSFCFDISSLSPHDVSEHLRIPVLVCLLNDACPRGMMWSGGLGRGWENDVPCAAYTWIRWRGFMETG